MLVTVLCLLLGWLDWNRRIVRGRKESLADIRGPATLQPKVFVRQSRMPMSFPRNVLGDQRLEVIVAPRDADQNKIARANPTRTNSIEGMTSDKVDKRLGFAARIALCSLQVAASVVNTEAVSRGYEAFFPKKWLPVLIVKMARKSLCQNDTLRSCFRASHGDLVMPAHV